MSKGLFAKVGRRVNSDDKGIEDAGRGVLNILLYKLV